MTADLFTLLRATLSLSTFCRLIFLSLVTTRTSSETANDPFGSVCWLHTGPHHLSKQVYIIVCFTRHLFANRMKDFKKFWSAIHVDLGLWFLVLGLGFCTLYFVFAPDLSGEPLPSRTK